MPVQRYKLVIAYRGTHYHGWQQQAATPTYTGAPLPPGEGLPTIQEAVARAVASVVQHPVNLVGSSRTDAGVHAKGQVAHFDTERVQIPRENIRRAANHRLPDDVLIRRIDPVPETFNAVRSTASKRYQYLVWNHGDRPVFFPDLAWHRWQRLDVDAMAAAAQHFVGTRDLVSFSRPGHGRENTVRTIHHCGVSHRAPRIVFSVEGSGFLWNTVRIIVGTLVEVGLGRYVPEDIPRMLAARDRQAAGSTAPPHGLYLQWIRFSEEAGAGPRERLAAQGAEGGVAT